MQNPITRRLHQANSALFTHGPRPDDFDLHVNYKPHIQLRTSLESQPLGF